MCPAELIESLRFLLQPTSTSVIHTYFSAISAVLFGAILAYLYTRRLEKRKAEILIIAEFSNDLKKISDLCERYWLADHSDNGKKAELAVVGYKLRAALTATAEYRELMKTLMGKKFQDFDVLDTRLSMIATGGNFQSSSMKAAPETFQEINSIIAKTEFILRSLRNGF